jgi:putative IMPACT (imprinted ancient) family translation regulator
MNAYGKAAEWVIQSVSFASVDTHNAIDYKSSIKYYSDIVQVISKFEGQIRKDFSGETLNIDIELPLDQEGQLSETLNDGSFGQVEIKKASANNTKEGSEVKGVGKRNSHPL